MPFFMQNLDFPFILLSATAMAGTIWLVDKIFFEKNREKKIDEKTGHLILPTLVDYSRSLFPVLLAVLILRSFGCQLFKVPTGSLEPTIMVGDLIAVNMYAYGLRLPVWHTRVLAIASPKRGDIALFRWPVDERFDFVKRVIGVPGDHISYINRVLFINGKEAKQTKSGTAFDHDSDGKSEWPVQLVDEDLNGIHHQIYLRPELPNQDFKDLVVPAGQYLMMGDNRDNSDDGRIWGFVTEDKLIGKGWRVVMNLNHFNHFGAGL